MTSMEWGKFKRGEFRYKKFGKWILFWFMFYFIYTISKKFDLDFVFKCIISTVFVVVVIRVLYTERYGVLSLKEDILRGVYDLMLYLKEPKIGMMQRYVGEYQIVKKAIDNAFIFRDYRIVIILYRLDEAINGDNINVLQYLDHEYLKLELDNIVKLKSLDYFLVHGLIFQIFFTLPVQIVGELVRVIQGYFSGTCELQNDEK